MLKRQAQRCYCGECRQCRASRIRVAGRPHSAGPNVRVLPEGEHTRIVAAPARHARQRRFTLSGQPLPLRGYCII